MLECLGLGLFGFCLALIELVGWFTRYLTYLMRWVRYLMSMVLRVYGCMDIYIKFFQNDQGSFVGKVKLGV